MYHVRKITEDTWYVGANDRRLALFESVYPVERGVSYNSYVILDEETVLLDTVDTAVRGQFMENLDHVLDGRPLNYLVVNHMEPDHCALIGELTARWPELTIVCNYKTADMLERFFGFTDKERIYLVGEGDTLNTGRHTLHFVMAPMVHWPEVMVSYDDLTRALFSADAFGTFGALNGNLFADEVEFARDWLPDARRYYTNIVGKYGTQVQNLLKKARTLEIDMVCPLHGPIWRQNIGWFIDKYQKWSTCTPEEPSVMIAYASVYGHTQNAAEILAGKLAERGVHNVAVYDVSVTDTSVIVAEAFRCSHLVFASTTYNAGIFVNMEKVLLDLKAHNLHDRVVALIENGSWAPTAGELMGSMFGDMKNMTLLGAPLTVKSALKPEQLDDLDGMADALCESGLVRPVGHPTPGTDAAKVEPNAFFKLSYGLFVLTARDGKKDNGCIVNTVIQLTDTPKRLMVTVNKANYTHDMIAKTGVCEISVLSNDVPFAIFKRFGYSSGRDTDKFAGLEDVKRASNGLLYLTAHANAHFSCRVTSTMEFETHSSFFLEITEAEVLSNTPSVTYADYFDHIKPKPAPPAPEQKGFVCTICGYVYEGDTLPADFICPICKHGVEAFVPLSEAK